MSTTEKSPVKRSSTSPSQSKTGAKTSRLETKKSPKPTNPWTLSQRTPRNVTPKPKLSPEQLNELVKEVFLFEMPKEFSYLWSFCKSIDHENPQNAFRDTLGFTLVGPYDILTGKVKKSYIKDSDQMLCHWRFYFDPPEMQTVIASEDGYHIGFFRDSPDEGDPILVANDGRSCVIEPVADNLLAVVYSEIQKTKKKGGPKKQLLEIEDKLKKFCERFKVKYCDATDKIRARKRKTNSKTFNKFGIVVPVSGSDKVGYRELPDSDDNLKKLFNQICGVEDAARKSSKAYSQLQHIISLVNYATDECDYGMGLELGLDLFFHGDKFFHSIIEFLLSQAYELLNKPQFVRIIKAHLNNRRRGFDLSAI